MMKLHWLSTDPMKMDQGKISWVWYQEASVVGSMQTRRSRCSWAGLACSDLSSAIHSLVILCL